jgi:tetratricopeptide (TPR) repeat protein
MELPTIDSLWNYSDPAATEQAFLKIVPRARQLDNADYLAQLLTQLARSQVLQRRYAAGHATLDEAAGLLSDGTPVARVRYLLERGRAWNDRGQTKDARAVFEQAHELALAAGCEALAVDAAHMLGVMEPLAAAAEWNHRAIELAERSDDPAARRWTGTLCINLGWNYQRLGNFAAAEEAFSQAIPALERIGNAARVRLARLCLAKNRRLTSDASGALTLLQELLGEIQAAGEPDGYVHEEIAECLLALRRDAESRDSFARAYASLSADPWFPPNEAPRLQRLKKLGGRADR